MEESPILTTQITEETPQTNYQHVSVCLAPRLAVLAQRAVWLLSDSSIKENLCIRKKNPFFLFEAIKTDCSFQNAKAESSCPHSKSQAITENRQVKKKKEAGRYNRSGSGGYCVHLYLEKCKHFQAAY